MMYYIKTPNKDFNVLVQKRLFELGYRWQSGHSQLAYTTEPILSMNTDTKKIMFGNKRSAVPKIYTEIEFAGLYSKQFIK